MKKMATSQPLSLRSELARLFRDSPEVGAPGRRTGLAVRTGRAVVKKSPSLYVKYGPIDERLMPTVEVVILAGSDANPSVDEVLDRYLPPVMRIIEEDSRGMIRGGGPIDQDGKVGYQIEVSDSARIV